ncbi:MAG: peptidoglycan recognition protein family protein [Planctomycetota bacterium]|jgi:hypothetical protein
MPTLPTTTLTNRTSRFSRRTSIVWVTFAFAMTAVIGLLALGDDPRLGGYVALNLGTLELDGRTAAPGDDPVFRIDQPLDTERWAGIVIHHLGVPAGDAKSVHRQHVDLGYQGLGYHFLIGNGSGLGDGVVHIGYRWNSQLPGAHCIGPSADWLNERTIGICLIGNGDKRAFTPKQLRHLMILVERLQRQLDIPADAVYLHSDVASVSSPGSLFPTGRLEQHLINRR